MSNQTELPNDLIFDNILIRLPIKPVVRFKLVSKLWYSTISSPQFGQAHFKFPHLNPAESLLIRSNNRFHYCTYDEGVLDDVDIASKFEKNLIDDVDFDIGDQKLVLVGSCNGLVCLGSTSGSLFIMWNPITREFSKFTYSEICEFSEEKCMFTWGFGYVSAVDDYKVVRICKKVFTPFIRVHVYSIRVNKWRRIDEGDSSHNFSDLRTTERLYRSGVLVNESLNWMGGVSSMLLWSERKILCFDLSLEVFNTFPHLDVCTPLTWTSTSDDECFDEFLCVIKGCMSKYGRFVRSGEGVISILKHPGETEEIHVSKDLLGSAFKNLIGFTTSDKFFTFYFGSRMPHLGILDLSSRPMKHTPLLTLEGGSKIECVSYSASLLSPPAITRMPEPDI